MSYWSEGLSGLLQPLSRSIGAGLLLAAVWLLGFQLLFYAQSFVDPDVFRSQLWLMLLDEVLGADTTEVASTVPSGWQFAAQRLPLVSAAGLLLVLATAHGWCLDRWLITQLPLRFGERISLLLGSGLAVQSLVMLLAGYCGWISAAPLVVAAGISLVLGFAGQRLAQRSIGLIRLSDGDARAAVTAGRQDARTERLLFWLIAVPWSVYLLWGAMTPPTDFDVREYHLQGPKEWFQFGRIHYLRHNVYTSFPFLTEMLSLSGMAIQRDWWSGALTGQLVLAVYQLLTCGIVVSAGRRWFGRGPGCLAGLIWLTTPWTLRISLIAYAEGSLSFYTTSAIVLSLILARVPAGGVRGRGLLLVGFLAGSAMASKYTGLLLAVLPIAVGWCVWWLRTAGSPLALWRSTDCRRGFLREAGLYTAGVVLAVGPWLLKNAVETGNPVFPLGWSVFGGSEWNEPLNVRWKHAHGAPEHSLSRVPQHFLDAAVRNKWTSPLLFGLAVPVLLLWRRSVELRMLLLATGWGFLTWWALTHRIDRFWVPLVPLLSLLAGVCVLLSSAMWWRGLVLGSVIAGTVFNLRFSTLALVGFHAGLMDLEGARQLTIRSDLQFLNQQLPKTARVLMVGEAEVFDADFALLYNTVFDDSVFEQLTGQAQPDEIVGRLRSAGVTHVLVNWREILRYRLPGSYGYAEYVQPQRFAELQSGGVLGIPRVLGQTSWSELSALERDVVQQWTGWQQLVKGDAWETVRLYPVQ